jgi:hypothetical protein
MKMLHDKSVCEMLGHATIAHAMDACSRVMPGMGDVAANALESALS